MRVSVIAIALMVQVCFCSCERMFSNRYIVSDHELYETGELKSETWFHKEKTVGGRQISFAYSSEYFKDGRLKSEQWKYSGNRESKLEFYKNGHLKSEERHENDKIVYGMYFEEDGTVKKVIGKRTAEVSARPSCSQDKHSICTLTFDAVGDTNGEGEYTIHAKGEPGKLTFIITGDFSYYAGFPLLPFPKDSRVLSENKKRNTEFIRRLLTTSALLIKPHSAECMKSAKWGTISVCFDFEGEKKPNRKILLTVEIRDSDGNMLATKSHECSDPRFDKGEVKIPYQGGIPVYPGIGGSIPLFLEGHLAAQQSQLIIIFQEQREIL